MNHHPFLNPMRLSPSNTALAVCGFLAIAVAIVFGQTVCHDFVLYDDNVYVYENPQVTQGLTSASIAWAMTTSRAANWHPLTWFSHILDCQFFGLWAGGHHLTSIVLHAITAMLLFLVLWRMTGDLWPSAFVATVFAIHPLRVESVAWVAERKDVLSGVFFMLTLAAYVSYVRRPFSLSRYLMVVAAFALGLMAKPTLVTLPCVLLLLDYWPLDRLKAPPAPPKEGKRPAKAKAKTRDAAASIASAPPRFSIPRRVILEKIPLFFLTAYSCLVTTVVQGEALREFDEMTVGGRFANAVISYAAYLGQFVWPTNLAVLYPHPQADLPIWNVIAASLVLATISAVAIACRRQIPAVLVGWLWYLGMMVPMIGIIQVGEQAMADRYTYLPQIGLCLASDDFLAKHPEFVASCLGVHFRQRHGAHEPGPRLSTAGRPRFGNRALPGSPGDRPEVRQHTQQPRHGAHAEGEGCRGVGVFSKSGRTEPGFRGGAYQHRRYPGEPKSL